MSRGRFASLNLGLGTQDAAARVRQNRRRVAAALGGTRIAFPHQVHGCAVHEIGAAGAPIPMCDAIVSSTPGVLVGVLGADCPGVLLVDVQHHALAVVHAGWRGVVAGVIPAALAHLHATYATAPQDVLAGIGPGISGPRYEVDEPVARRIAASFGHPAEAIASARPGHAEVDLRRAVQRQLQHAGVPAASIECFEACTYDDPARFFSHRRDAGRTGRHALVAGWQS